MAALKMLLEHVMDSETKDIQRGEQFFLLILENDWGFASSVLDFLHPASTPWAKHCRRILVEYFVNVFRDRFATRRLAVHWVLKWLRAAATEFNAQQSCQKVLGADPLGWTDRDRNRVIEGLRLLMREDDWTTERQVQASFDLMKDAATVVELDRLAREIDHYDCEGPEEESLW